RLPREAVAAPSLKIHGDEAVPVFEVDTQTVDILYDLAECSEARDRDVSLLIETMKHKATEYDNESKSEAQVLSFIKVSFFLVTLKIVKIV
uniref:Uncharacterized protein n=1 Tax=Athene cunicularia TaxID=194338 RepID=A0A663N8R2_ATHCN